jgi:uncharacterized membrane protein YdjX (TVP38/TMEM64 family)
MPRSIHSSRDAARRGPFSFGVRLKVLLAMLGLVVAANVLYFSGFEWREVPEMLQRINRPLALLVMATLPVVGFPISAVYVASGALFGPWVGGLVVAGVTLVHVLATHVLGRSVLRGPIERLRHRWHHRLPEVPPEEHATLVAMIVIVPVLPYLVRNCLLAFSKVPLRFLVGVGVPLYVLRAYVSIFLGDLTNDPSLRTLFILGAVSGLECVASALLFRRLKQRCRPAEAE